MTTGTRKGISSEMNVTPLIDVLLVLLIIFMVLMPQHHFGQSAEIPLPSNDTSTPRENLVIIRLLDSRQSQRPVLKINEEQVAWDSLENRLREIYRLKHDKVAFLRGDPEINFERVAEVLDISHRAGVDRIGLMTEKR